MKALKLPRTTLPFVEVPRSTDNDNESYQRDDFDSMKSEKDEKGANSDDDAYDDIENDNEAPTNVNNNIVLNENVAHISGVDARPEILYDKMLPEISVEMAGVNKDAKVAGLNANVDAEVAGVDKTDTEGINQNEVHQEHQEDQEDDAEHERTYDPQLDGIF